LVHVFLIIDSVFGTKEIISVLRKHLKQNLNIDKFLCDMLSFALHG
jgi:hypothetical protein